MVLVVCAVLLQDSEIEKLIEQLPAAEAHRKLVELGRQAIPALQKAKDRARTKPVIVEIRRKERREEARRLLSPDLLAEAPVVLDLLVSDRRDDWLTLLRRCAGVRVVDGELVRMSRAWSRATARDLVLLVRLCLDGGLRDDTVEGVLFAMSDSWSARPAISILACAARPPDRCSASVSRCGTFSGRIHAIPTRAGIRIVPVYEAEEIWEKLRE